jgi:glycosyltransferase involved in cell wall biosynthesis
MDLFVLTSRKEGFPNVLVEAQAAGVPVVSCDVGGAGETFIDGRTGWLVHPGTALQLAQAVCAALRDPSRLRRVGRAAALHVRESFPARGMVNRTLDAYFSPQYTASIAGLMAHAPPAAQRHIGADGESLLLAIGTLGPGGAERQLVTLARALRGGRYRPKVLCWHCEEPPHDFHRGALPGDLAVEQLPHRLDPWSALERCENIASGLRAHLAANRGRLLWELDDIARCVPPIRAARPAVIHCWLDETNIKAGIAAVLAGVPRVVLSTRNLAPDHFELWRPYMRAAYLALARLPQVRIINNSLVGARDYERWLELPPGTIATVKNGYDFAPFDAIDAAAAAEFRHGIDLAVGLPVVGGILRLAEEKRPLLWVEAAARIAEREPSCHFLLIGDGLLRDAVQARIAALGLTARCRRLAATRDIPRALASMDVLLMASRAEGLPNVLIEAQAAGVPVVSTAAGGAAETFVDGESGVLINDDTAQALAGAVLTLLASPARRAAFGAAGRAHARAEFGQSRMVREVLDLYDSGIEL